MLLQYVKIITILINNNNKRRNGIPNYEKKVFMHSCSHFERNRMQEGFDDCQVFQQERANKINKQNVD